MRSPKHVAARNYSKFRLKGLIAGIDAIVDKGAIVTREEYELKSLQQRLLIMLGQWESRKDEAYNNYKILHG